MPRSAPPDRAHRLVECATRIFVEQGYAQTRMDDVAEALGVAKGTLYLYVESKDALFDLVCRSADDPTHDPELPVKTPRSGATLAYIVKRLADQQTLAELATALEGARREARIELVAIVGELFDLLQKNRTAIKLIDRSARDIPELGRVWFGGSRQRLIDALARYIERGARDGELRPVKDPAIAARFVLETCVFWAIHRHWDALRQEVVEDNVRPSVLDLVGAALLPPDGPRKNVLGVRAAQKERS